MGPVINNKETKLAGLHYLFLKCVVAKKTRQHIRPPMHSATCLIFFFFFYLFGSCMFKLSDDYCHYVTGKNCITITDNKQKGIYSDTMLCNNIGKL